MGEGKKGNWLSLKKTKVGKGGKRGKGKGEKREGGEGREGRRGGGGEGEGRGRGPSVLSFSKPPWAFLFFYLKNQHWARAPMCYFLEVSTMMILWKNMPS
jgi:hypothetical protein